MASLASSLASSGLSVTYVAGKDMSQRRSEQGWTAPAIGDAQLYIADDIERIKVLADRAPSNSVHLVQGLRGKEAMSVVREQLVQRRLRQWAIMETVDDRGWRGLPKKFAYSRVIQRWRPHLDGVLAIGHLTPKWISERGLGSEKVFPFAYFLSDNGRVCSHPTIVASSFQFLYVGQFIGRKRIDLLFKALSSLKGRDFVVRMVGSGPLEGELRAAGKKLLGDRVEWLGRRPVDTIPAIMASADCCVLPSEHDGWGAVVCEALMAGTPVICSDACGAAGVVGTSGFGGVFPTGNADALADLLANAMAQGSPSAAERQRLSEWSKCLGAKTGARYFNCILEHVYRGGDRPAPPWESEPALVRWKVNSYD